MLFINSSPWAGRYSFSALYFLAAILLPAVGLCESYTLETYYPSPAGIYTNITVTSSTVLARDGGAVNVGTPAKPARLDVNGNANVTGNAKVTGVVVPGNLAADPTDPAQKVEGAIYFNTTSKNHRVFKNGAWTDLSGGGEVLLASDIPCNATNAGKRALLFSAGTEAWSNGEYVTPGTPSSLRWAVCQYVTIIGSYKDWRWQ